MPCMPYSAKYNNRQNRNGFGDLDHMACGLQRRIQGCQIIPYGFVNSAAFPKGKEQDSGAHAVSPAEGGLFRMVTGLQTFDGGGEVNSIASREGGAARSKRGACWDSQ